MITATYHLEPQLRERLNRATSTRMRAFMRIAIKDAARPMLATAKAHTPVKSGKLRESLGMVPFATRSSVGVRIEPRTSFSFNDLTRDLVQGPGLSEREMTANQRTIVTRKRRKNTKAIGRALAKGMNVTNDLPYFYINKIEEGMDRKGRIARKAGGARMLSGALAQETQRFFRIVGDEVMRYIVI